MTRTLIQLMLIQILLAQALLLAACAPVTAAGPEPVAAAQVMPALAPDATLTRIAFGSCLHQARPQPILDVIAADAPQLMLMIGDNVYGDVSDAALTELKAAYALQAQSEPLNRLRASTPMLVTWDDHDYGLNDAGAGFFGAAEAKRLFQTFWQLDPARHQASAGIEDAFVFGPEGRRVQVILLDTRSYRSDLAPTDERGAVGRERYVPDDDPAKTMLGEAQWAWLEDRLREPADLRLLVSSIQLLADGHGWEAWRTLPAERERMYRTLAASGAEGLVVLSGDRHRAGIYRRDDVLDYPLVEITSSALNLPIPGVEEEPGPFRLGPTVVSENYGRLEIDWDAGTLALQILDLEGRVVLEERLTLPESRQQG